MILSLLNKLLLCEMSKALEMVLQQINLQNGTNDGKISILQYESKNVH